MGSEKDPGFTISCENPEFQNKMHEVFDGINELRSNLPIQEGDGKKRDQNEETKIRKPDFLVRPSRYTKYSLRDTELSDNAANSRIALQFLRETKQNNEPCESAVTADDKEAPFSKKHVFKMPEHSAGAPKPKERKISQKDCATVDISCDKVELDHLEENVTSIEFRNEIALKFDEDIKRSVVMNPSKDTGSEEKFKAVPKRKRNLREKAGDCSQNALSD